MTDHIEDKDFEKYLDGQSRVSRGYARLKELEPPEAMDRAILGHARREAGKANGNWRASRWNRWMSSFSIAAVVTLALALVLRVELAPDAVLMDSHLSASYMAEYEMDTDLVRLVPATDETAAKAVAELNLAESGEGMASGGTAQADGGRAWDLPGERVDDDFANEPVVAARMKAEASGQTLMDSPASKPQAAALARAPAETEIADKKMAVQSMNTVTGSRIERVDVEGPSPAAVIDRNNSDKAAGLRAERQAFLRSVRDDPALAQQRYSTPDDWLIDIDLLLDEGRTVDARDELEVFKLAYPEFELKKRYTF